jgi:hypothetical protein
MEGQLNTLDRVQNKAAKFAPQRNDLNWEIGTARKIARICALFKTYTGERRRTAISDSLQSPCYVSRVDNDKKISYLQML